VKRIKIIDKKLGREGADGQHWPNTNVIEVDPRLGSRRRMGAITHETLHYLFPHFSEEQILEAEGVLVNTLWKDGFRRIEK